MPTLANAIIAWQKVHGRHDLPWQNTTDPYAIWVSEIMLQQTQVAAVIGYYGNFMQRFPSISTLAEASEEEVLQYWSGLGYYSRARNLHSAALKIVDHFNGKFPKAFEDILSLPGIGRSTAAAISTFAFNQPMPILDGNVKRVFARYFLIEGWPSLPKIEKSMWEIAVRENPTGSDQAANAIAYTQGLMDLGATVCTRSRPTCEVCPFQPTCGAFAQQRVKDLPTPKPKKAIPQKHTTMLVLLNCGEVMLEKRPSKGIWGGLWSMPEIGMEEIGAEVALSRFGLSTEAQEPLAIVQHAFSHYKLDITPQPLVVTKQNLNNEKCASNTRTHCWLPIEDAIGAAIPTPVRNILLSLQHGQSTHYA